MTKRDLTSKISTVKEHLRLASKFQSVSLKDLKERADTRLAVERVLFLVAQSAIDLAESYIHFKGYRKPSSMHESFHVLREMDVLDGALTERLLQMVGFRNVLTHGYSRIDYEIVLEVLKNRLDDVKKLVSILER